MTPRCLSCVYGTRNRCLVCDHYAPRPALVRVPSWQQEEREHSRPGSWHNTEPTRRAGVEDVSGWDDDRPNIWG